MAAATRLTADRVLVGHGTEHDRRNGRLARHPHPALQRDIRCRGRRPPGRPCDTRRRTRTLPAHAPRPAACRRAACACIIGPRAASKKWASRRRTVSLAACSAATSSVAIGPRTTDGTERREDSLVHGELEPLRREGLVEDPLHPIDVQSLGCGDEGMRDRIRARRAMGRSVDRRKALASPSPGGRVTPDRCQASGCVLPPGSGASPRVRQASASRRGARWRPRHRGGSRPRSARARQRRSGVPTREWSGWSGRFELPPV